MTPACRFSGLFLRRLKLGTHFRSWETCSKYCAIHFRGSYINSPSMRYHDLLGDVESKTKIGRWRRDAVIKRYACQRIEDYVNLLGWDWCSVIAYRQDHGLSLTFDINTN